MARLVTCPKCGRLGRLAVWKFRAKGHEYYYELVVHPDNKKCILKRVEPPKPAPKPSEELLAEVERLRAENEQLRRQLEEAERARAEAEARAQAARYIFAASLTLGRPQLEALRAMYIIKKGYTPEQREVARQVMHAIVERGLQVGVAVVAFPQPEHLQLLA